MPEQLGQRRVQGAATGQNVVMAVNAAETYLYEPKIGTRVLPEVLSGTHREGAGLRLRVDGNWQAKSIAVISGTELTRQGPITRASTTVVGYSFPGPPSSTTRKRSNGTARILRRGALASMKALTRLQAKGGRDPCPRVLLLRRHTFPPHPG
jgi:hypothetical protein